MRLVVEIDSKPVKHGADDYSVPNDGIFARFGPVDDKNDESRHDIDDNAEGNGVVDQIDQVFSDLRFVPFHTTTPSA